MKLLSTLPYAAQVAAILTADDAAITSAYKSMIGRRGAAKPSPDRCPCGAMTRQRAQKRGHRCEFSVAQPAKKKEHHAK